MKFPFATQLAGNVGCSLGFWGWEQGKKQQGTVPGLSRGVPRAHRLLLSSCAHLLLGSSCWPAAGSHPSGDTEVGTGAENHQNKHGINLGQLPAITSPQPEGKESALRNVIALPRAELVQRAAFQPPPAGLPIHAGRC